MKQPITIPSYFETYLATIKNSQGTKLFKNFYAKVNGKETDITKNGILSCAFYASNILHMSKLINSPHVTVSGTIADLEKHGWQKIKRPKIGSVLVWEAIMDRDGNPHRHIGFYIGHDQAISNNSKKGYPVAHHWTFGNKKNKPVRKVENIYWSDSSK